MCVEKIHPPTSFTNAQKSCLLNSIAFFGAALIFFILSIISSVHPFLVVLLLSLLGFNVGGFYKSAATLERQYFHSITASFQVWNISDFIFSEWYMQFVLQMWPSIIHFNFYHILQPISFRNKTLLVDSLDELADFDTRTKFLQISILSICTKFHYTFAGEAKHLA